jgi:hypothetical protein
VYSIDFAVGTGAAQSSATSIPANAIVFWCDLVVTTAYSAGTTISIGQTGSVSLLQATTDNTATALGEYFAPQRTPWGSSSLPVLATVSGGPSVGAGTVTVLYAAPQD